MASEWLQHAGAILRRALRVGGAIYRKDRWHDERKPCQTTASRRRAHHHALVVLAAYMSERAIHCRENEDASDGRRTCAVGGHRRSATPSRSLVTRNPYLI